MNTPHAVEGVVSARRPSAGRRRHWSGASGRRHLITEPDQLEQRQNRDQTVRRDELERERDRERQAGEQAWRPRK